MNGWVAIVNPAAGRPGDARACADLLLREGLADRAEITQAPGHATRLARAAAQAEGIIAVGGDGTVQEVLAGLDRDRQILAVMPVGHGNCLARDLGLGTLVQALAALRGRRPRTIDLIGLRFQVAEGGWTELLAASTLAVGYVAQVVDLGRNGLPWLGRAAYATASAVTVPRRLGMDLAVDGRGPVRHARTGLVVNNTAHLANYRAFPAARLDDGRLDVMETGAGWARQQVHNTAILAGSGRFGPARLYQAEQVGLRLDRPATLMVDGELWPGVVAFAAACLGRACRCLVLPA